MTLEEAIEHAREISNRCGKCAEEHAQLAEWLEELRQWHELTKGIELPKQPMTQFQPKDLERENDALHIRLNAAYAKMDRMRKVIHNQREQLFATQKALEERNEGVLKSRWRRTLERTSAENGELRELFVELYEDQCADSDRWKYRDRMRELGIEVG